MTKDEAELRHYHRCTSYLKRYCCCNPRTVDDHIKWALEHGQFSEALEIAERADPLYPLLSISYWPRDTWKLGEDEAFPGGIKIMYPITAP